MAVAQLRRYSAKSSNQLETKSDAILAQEATHDPNAFATLYLRYANQVFRHCYRRLGNREAAEDATSLVFTKTLTGLDRFDPNRGTFAAWLFTIAHHVSADHFRSQGRYVGTQEFPDPVDPAETPEEIALARDEAGNLRRALEQLSPREREVIELRLAGLSSAEISDVLGCQRNAVAQAQYRAIGRLRELLGPEAAQRGRNDV